MNTEQIINILRKEWYHLNNLPTDTMDARQLAIHIGQKSGIIKAINLINKEDMLATHEEQQIFDEKRNYHYTNTDNPIDFPKETTNE